MTRLSCPDICRSAVLLLAFTGSVGFGIPPSFPPDGGDRPGAAVLDFGRSGDDGKHAEHGPTSSGPTAAAGVVCTDPVGCQLPDQLGGFPNDRNIFINVIVAEGFVPLASGPVTTVCWWGGWFQVPIADCGPGVESYAITYYTDASGLPGAVHAGPMPVAVTKALTGETLGGILFEWEFEATHPPVPVTAGECYWIEISNDTTGTTCFSFWEAGAPGDGHVAIDVGNGFSADFSSDVAICLDIEIDPNGCPTPGACCDTATGNCTDDVLPDGCVGPNEDFLPATRCCELECGGDGGFSASGVALLSNIPVEDFPDDPIAGPQTLANEVWGYLSPSGREYAILGLWKGAAFVEVTDPLNPVIVGYVSGGGVNQVWRDMATFGEHAYIVSDGAGIGLQVVDLTGIDGGVITDTVTDLGVGYSRAHNVYVNPDSGFLYLCIPNLNGGNGLSVVSLSDPAHPVIAGFWTDTDPGVRCHDVQVVSYTSGPYTGREIAFCFAEDDGIRIVDVTDKANMFRMSSLVYPTTTYTHQGWLSDDRQFLFIGDELDELNNPVVDDTVTYVADVGDLNNPTLATTFSNGLCSIDHNLMVRGEFVFEANYTAGLRIFDISDVNTIQEVGFFDTHPDDNTLSFNGAWGVYTALPSGVVLVSDEDHGLFVLDASEATGGDQVPGDSDGDGDVDLFDLAAFLDCVSGPIDLGPECGWADLDSDNDVDFHDFQLFQLAFTGPG